MSKKRPANPSQGQPGVAAWETLKTAMERAIRIAHTTADVEAVEKAFQGLIPEQQQQEVDTVLGETQTPTKAYRVGLVIQLAYRVGNPTLLDVTKRHSGARGEQGVAGRLGTLLRSHHIKAPIDAYQNIAKNTKDLARGNLLEFDSVLRWASLPDRQPEELVAVLNYACLRIAQTARPVKPMPPIDRAKLTFAAVIGLFRELLDVESRGAYQQFLVAALLHARNEQDGKSQKVETKKLNASDQSSKTAGDVQLRTGTKVDEAFEVTANDWAEKLPRADDTIRSHDLARLHIIGRVRDVPAMLAALRAQPHDISAVDLDAFVAVTAAELRKQFREAALNRLYEFLDRYQSDIDLVNGYVDRVTSHNLTA